MKTTYQLQQENARLLRACQTKEDYERQLLTLRNLNYDLRQHIMQLEWRLEGYVPCEYCDGEGSKLAANSGHPQGPDCIEQFCKTCDGEGWVKGDDK